MSLLIDALTVLPSTSGRSLAFALAQKWIQSNYAGWKQHGQMFEKVQEG